ncbi:hypothetical protein EVG20_g498 [Dentipellis fragilis]|uniref:Uncharacterized protein n=1 Tax=Dentipellis fragilis TaxID=205917 RepID=A0A4Y9ZCD3_9AGAM|nr:hypothetical protein EVG20_g498 [Dentipellis fragilis]
MSSQSDAPSTLPQFSLSPAKLRALISLYHQSGNFITPANLDTEIDKAFTDVPDLVSVANSKFTTYTDLKADVSARRVAPKYIQTEDYARERTGYGGSDATRRNQVFEALYGTANVSSIGLGLLEDEWEMAEERLKDAKNESKDA